MSLEPDTKWLIFGLCGILAGLVVLGLFGYVLYSIADYFMSNL